MKYEFNIVNYGAAADNKTVNTKAIQDAVDDCHNAGGGKVVCSAGKFVTGTIFLKSNVEFHLNNGCELIGSKNLDDYPDFVAQGYRSQNPPERSTKCLIGAVEAENISLTGAGMIDGNGLAFYADKLPEGKKRHNKPDTPRPRIIMFYKCKEILVEQITLVNSPCWTSWFMQCDNLQVHKIKIHSELSLVNVDGMDIDGCKNVTVSDCILQTEDDAIVLRNMQNLYDQKRDCANITVTNCVLESDCQCIRIGCPSDGKITNAVFSNLTLRGNRAIVFQNPHRYFRKEANTTADIHDIQFNNININVRDKPIWMNIEKGIKLTRLGAVDYRNLRIKSGKPIVIEGNSESPIDNISLSNIDIKTDDSQALFLRYCEDIKLGNVNLNS